MQQPEADRDDQGGDRSQEDDQVDGLTRLSALRTNFRDNVSYYSTGNYTSIHTDLGVGLSPSHSLIPAQTAGNRDPENVLSGPASEKGSCKRDCHHKRPKVHYFMGDGTCEATLPLDITSCAFLAEEHSTCMEWSDDFGDGICYRFDTVNGSSNTSQIDANTGVEIGANKSLSDIMVDNFETRMDLTEDLLHTIFSFLDHVNLCRAASVCKQWRAASAHDDFWRILNFENRNISAGQFEDVCNRYPKANEVNIFGAPDLPLLAVKAVSSLGNLQVLTLGKGYVGDNFFHILPGSSTLRSLIINDAVLGSGGQEIPIFHDKLHYLEITKCRVLRLSVRCPQLGTLSLKRSNMIHISLTCPILRDLDIGSCHKLSDAAIHMAATSCPLLESLDISNCSSVSDETMRDISLTCSNLHNLDASYCPSLSLESVRLPMLTVLKLQSCDSITSASMNAISHSYLLEVLELDDCSLLTSVSLNLSRLNNIRLVHCRRFVDLNLRSVMLSSITVSNCPLLSRISINSSSLNKLVLQKQESLSTLDLWCQGLKEVDLSDCESLSNSVCEVFSDKGCCPVLGVLVLDNCESLTALKLCSMSLVTLSLAGCRAISSLELTCPFLEKVCLDGCDHLERATFSPVGLRSLNLGICPKLRILDIEASNMLLLELKGCGVLSEASINCPLLTSLDASFCSRLKDECLAKASLSCPLIESLILMSCPSVGFAGLYALRCLQHLSILDLSYTFLMNLQPVLESCMQLKVLKLQACKYLSESSLEGIYKRGTLPSLRELDLSYGTLGQSAIEKLLACCTHLTHVSLNGCVSMHDLDWGHISEYPSSDDDASFCGGSHVTFLRAERLLESLNLVGCPNIKKIVIPPTAGCLRLSSLSLSLSANLKEVDVACANLCFLNLSNCYALESLRLRCPRLITLFLQSSSIIEAEVVIAISECHALETLDIRFCPKIASASMGRFRAVRPSLRRIFSSLPP